MPRPGKRETSEKGAALTLKVSAMQQGKTAVQLLDVNGVDYMPALRATKVVISPIVAGHPVRMVIECCANVDVEALPDGITVEPIKTREPIVMEGGPVKLSRPVLVGKRGPEVVAPASLTREHSRVCPNRADGKHVWKDDPTALESRERCEHCRQTRKPR